MSINFQLTISRTMSLFENVLNGVRHRQEKIAELYELDATDNE